MSDLDQGSHYNLGCLTLLTIMWTWIYGTARVSPQLTRHYWTPYLGAAYLEPWFEENKMKNALLAWQQLFGDQVGITENNSYINQF